MPICAETCLLLRPRTSRRRRDKKKGQVKNSHGQEKKPSKGSGVSFRSDATPWKKITRDDGREKDHCQGSPFVFS